MKHDLETYLSKNELDLESRLMLGPKLGIYTLRCLLTDLFTSQTANLSKQTH